jgi:D-aminoacyl-tRNA deacylase
VRALVQRVSEARCEVAGETTGRIDNGLLVYVGVGPDDMPDLAAAVARKVAHLRIFEDAGGKLNLSVQDVEGAVLAIPNFTLLADARKGRRPAFNGAAPADAAEPLHRAFVDALRAEGCSVAEGRFGAHMHVHALADGPVNLVIDLP